MLGMMAVMRINRMIGRMDLCQATKYLAKAAKMNAESPQVVVGSRRTSMYAPMVATAKEMMIVPMRGL
jgi:hypothetical protein